MKRVAVLSIGRPNVAVNKEFKEACPSVLKISSQASEFGRMKIKKCILNNLKNPNRATTNL